MMAQKFILICCALLAGLLARTQENNSLNLMPVPVLLTAHPGRVDIGEGFRVSVRGKPDRRIFAEASRFVRRLSERTGIFLDHQGFVSPSDSSPSAALLIQIRRPGSLKLGEDESYSLESGGGQVILSAVTDIGAIRGLETLLQLVSADEKGYFFPGLSIRDYPRFAWRGLLLDVALHFMPVDQIKRTLDGMACVKMNVLHLHLCNDQGFRVESRRFPRLQQVASDGVYYTQQEIRELVAYASQRGIRIVPEFVVPAHTTAILTAYPQWASVKRKYSLQRYFGVFDPVMDPTNERLYPFLDTLFSEMASLFPDAYFHIGGDENTGKDWQSEPHIRRFMAERGMKSFMDLQTYFNRRLLPIIEKNGKTMMGWDEILQPGVPKQIVIQSWRGNASFYGSLRQGYRAILSYGYYIDLIQPASYHYQNDPIPDSAALSAQEQQRVLGGEATMWSELVSPLTVDSRIWPRTAAIAERLWSPRSVTDTEDMYRRLDIISLGLEALGLRHRTYKQVLLRQLAHGDDTRSLEVLSDLIEPLKIYERNQGNTMYTVFSPLTKLADLASPDQPQPRIFSREVDSFLLHPSPALRQLLWDKLNCWKQNDALFQRLLLGAPVLREAAGLSRNLSLLAGAGLDAMEALDAGRKMDGAWLEQQLLVAARARQQGGRCELQVVDAVQRLIERAAR